MKRRMEMGIRMIVFFQAAKRTKKKKKLLDLVALLGGFAADWRRPRHTRLKLSLSRIVYGGVGVCVCI